jgi:hypothetical protein
MAMSPVEKLFRTLQRGADVTARLLSDHGREMSQQDRQQLESRLSRLREALNAFEAFALAGLYILGKNATDELSDKSPSLTFVDEGEETCGVGLALTSIEGR